MNIKDITYFIEVVKERSFTKAANNLYISQPALSKIIKNLEKEAKTQLIERSSKSFKLTNEGELFYESAKNSIDVIHQELNKLQDSFTGYKKVLNVGLPPVIGTVYFTSVIANFRSENHDIDIRIIEEGSNNIKDRVEDESIDVGVVIFPFDDEKLLSIPITSGNVMLVVSKNHRLSDKETVDVKELIDEKFITFNEKFMMFDKTMKACKESGFEPNIIMKTSQWDYIVEMVALDQGITIMPKPIVERFKMDDIKLIPISSPHISWDIGFIIKKEKYISKSLRLFMEYTIKNIKNKSIKP